MHQQVADMITGIGAIICFLPPYSPELNPIENVFSKEKSFVQANDGVYQSTLTPHMLILMAFCTVTKIDCINFIRHSGYMY